MTGLGKALLRLRYSITDAAESDSTRSNTASRAPTGVELGGELGGVPYGGCGTGGGGGGTMLGGGDG